MHTNTLDECYLQYSNFTTARTRREIQAKRGLELLIKIIESLTDIPGPDLHPKELLTVSSARVWIKEFDTKMIDTPHIDEA